MTTHARFERLAAAAIDFALTDVEREQLDRHLAGCPACRATAGAYRRDALALRETAFVPAPAAVRVAVLGASARTAPRIIAPWRLVAAAALLAAALVGALVAVGAWNARPTLVQTVPVPSPSAVPTPAPTLDASLPSPAPSSLEVATQVGATCDGSLAAVSTPTVQAQPDGIHLLVENTSGQLLDFGIEDETGLTLEGDSVPGTSGAYTYDLAPGTYRFTCNASVVPFTVVDPAVHYVSPQLSCATPGSGTTGTTDFAPGARRAGWPRPRCRPPTAPRYRANGCRRARRLPAGRFGPARPRGPGRAGHRRRGGNGGWTRRLVDRRAASLPGLGHHHTKGVLMAALRPAGAGFAVVIAVVVEVGAILGFVAGRFVRRLRGSDHPA